MNLHEYQAKRLFKKYSIPVPIGYVCSTFSEAEDAISRIALAPWIVKCQVHAGARGKAGGVKCLHRKEEVRVFVKDWIGKRLITDQTSSKGNIVNQILIESCIPDIYKEFYLSIVIDRSLNRVVFMASSEGGIEVEKMVGKAPSLIHKVVLNSINGAFLYQARELAFKLDLIAEQNIEFCKIFMNLSRMFFERDLIMLEVNPLVMTKKGKFVCLDGKLIVDSNALFRQPELVKFYDCKQEDYRETHAKKFGLNYVALQGNIACMVNGAGLAMATMDIIKHYGGYPANFLDVGGCATIEGVTEAFKIILSDSSVKVIFINIFGGIVRCDLIADGIVAGVSEVNIKIPIVVRFEGNNASIGAKKLTDSSLNIISEPNLIDAVKRAVEESKNVYFNR